MSVLGEGSSAGGQGSAAMGRCEDVLPCVSKPGVRVCLCDSEAVTFSVFEGHPDFFENLIKVMKLSLGKSHNPHNKKSHFKVVVLN